MHSTVQIMAFFLLVFSLGIASSSVVRVDPRSSGDAHSSGDAPSLQQLLCDSIADLNNTILLLSTSAAHTISPGELCLLQHVENLTIMADPLSGKLATIHCIEENTMQQKLTFLSSTDITLANIVFTDCGDVLINPELATDKFESSVVQFLNVTNMLLQNTSVGVPVDLASPSLRACFCRPNWTANSTVHPCLTNTVNISTYPGRSISINIAVVDTVTNTPVFSGVEIASDFTSLHVPLGQQCTAITIPFMSNATDVVVTIDVAVISHAPSSFINVTVADCPLGFGISSSLNLCTCLPFLDARSDLVCNISDGTLKLLEQNWLGLVDGVVAFGETCFVGYCIDVPEVGTFTLNVTDLCANNRTGTLCGRCVDGLSSTLGSDVVCQQCSNLWLLTIPLFMIAGVVLVVTLFLLRLTISMGTINGVIFNANLFVAINLVPYNQLPVFLKFPYVGINLLSLGLGFPLCFHSNMGELEKAFLNFLFPIYLFLIVGIIIVVCRYSSRLSKLTANSSVQVLATLVFLSYASLLGAVFKIIRYNGIVVLNVSEMTRFVWSDDGNVTYMQHPTHIVLFVLALLVYLGMVLPYTVLITAAPFMYRFKIINKFRAFLDAHYGPYKDRYRFWFGVRLWTVQLIFLVSATLRFLYPAMLLVMQIVLTVLVVAEAYVKPYKSNKLNLLDTVLVLAFTLVVAAANVSFIALSDSIAFPIAITTCIFVPPISASVGILCYHLKLACCPKYQFSCPKSSRPLTSQTANKMASSALNHKDAKAEVNVQMGGGVNDDIGLREPVMDFDDHL